MNTKSGRLAGELAIVTGATSGLGIEIARLFVAEGAQVVGVGRDPGRGAELTRRTGAHFVAADLARSEDCARVVERAVELIGGVTVLVNNAVPASAIARDASIEHAVLEVWDEMFQVIVLGAASLCAASIPHMRRAGHGSIVNISSRVAALGTPNLAAYGACKAALESMARSITADHARECIRANTVRPGYIVHEVRDADRDEATLKRVAEMHLTRLTTAADVAAATLYLASTESATVSGIVIPVDGGSSAVRGRTLG
jgi:NAD(P)-dependent dehydrogenase (short-subunit alcohol dehydrogenase family)